MDEVLRRKIRWCSRVVNATGMGDVVIVVDNLGTMYNIKKNGRVLTQFRGIDDFVGYCENLIEKRYEKH